jgi:transposase
VNEAYDYKLNPEDYKGFTLTVEETYEAGDIKKYRATPDDSVYRCPVCGSSDCTKKGTAPREWLMPCPGHKSKVTVVADIPRVHCKSCGITRQVDVGFALPKRHYVKAFAAQVVAFLSAMSISAIAINFNLDWDTIYTIFSDWLEVMKKGICLDNLKRIGIDETSVGKGHRYITIVIDLDTGSPVFVNDGKSEEALLPFWEMLGAERMQNIECVAMDMGCAFQSAVRKHLPNADIVFDRFHVVQLVNRYLDNLRREEHAKAIGEGKRAFIRCRFLLLKNDENLNEARHERERRDALLNLNKPLFDMHLMSLEIRDIWRQGSKCEAEEELGRILRAALSSDVKLIRRLGESLYRYKDGILAYYDHRITSGVIEGVNNKIKTKARSSYGFRNKNFYKLIVYAIRELDPKKMLA